MGSDALQAARLRAEGMDPEAAARAVGGRYDGTAERGRITVEFLGSGISLALPSLEPHPESAPLPDHMVALIVYHLALSDGTEPTGRLISFAELPDAVFYARAFRGYTGETLARRFGNDGELLGRAALSLGGEPAADVADAAWRVPALPKVPVTVAWWSGDEEFGPRVDLFFDETAPRHLTTDGCAVLGSWLTSVLSRFAAKGSGAEGRGGLIG